MLVDYSVMVMVSHYHSPLCLIILMVCHFDYILNLFSWKTTKLIIIMKYDYRLIFVYIFLFLSIQASCCNLCLLFILIFSLHNNGHPLSAVPILLIFFWGRHYPLLYENNNIS